MMNAMQFGATLKPNTATALLKNLKHSRNVKEWATIDAETQRLTNHFADSSDNIMLSFRVDKREDSTNFTLPRYITPILHLPEHDNLSEPLELTRFKISTLNSTEFVTELFNDITVAVDNKIAEIKATTAIKAS
ncbi:MAG: hypothetical protein U0003_01545 [Vampirovibrionales bacterium]